MDDQTLGPRFEAHRRELRAHCYRMLGSAPDADDATQDTILKAWQARASLRDEAGLRAWLYRIATNVCLDALAKRGPRVLAHDAFPPAEAGAAPRPFLESTIWIGPYVEGAPGVDAEHARAEHVTLAFIAALQHLPARQRAALLLRDVVELSAEEASVVLDTTPGAVEAALQRARNTMREHDGEGEVRGEPPPEVLERYVAAWQAGDPAAFVALLCEDASFVMPPTPVWYQGREAVSAFVAARYRDARWHLEHLRANGRPGFALYRALPDGTFTAHGIQVLDFADAHIARIQTFLAMGDDRNFRTFALPARLDENRQPIVIATV